MERFPSADPAAAGTIDKPWRRSGREATESSLAPHPDASPELWRQRQRISDQTHLVERKQHHTFKPPSLYRPCFLWPSRDRVTDSYQVTPLRGREHRKSAQT